MKHKRHYRLHHDPLSSHQQVANLVLKLNHSPILDVGPAYGFLGELLTDRNFVIDAVEPNSLWAQQAEPHYRKVYNCSIEEADLTEKTYRCVVCADVLEHTVDPIAVLQRLRLAAADDATFLISLPNIAHLAVRLMLLAGYFPQMDRGILDRTHLHFYTRQTAQEMITRAGFRVIRSIPTVLPLDEIKLLQRSPGMNLLTKLQHGILRIAPHTFGFQWIFIARSIGSGIDEL